MNKLFSLLLTIFLSFLLISCEKKNENKLKIAASSTPHAEILEQIAPLLQKKGVEMEILVVDDFHAPNRLLQEGEVDANYFQHLPFLQAQSQEFGYELEPLVSSHIEPMGLYSTKVKQLADLKKGAVIAVPTDPTNQARALLLLEKEKMISLNHQGINVGLNDIKESAYQFVEVDPPLAARLLDDVDLSAITANFALQASLSPLQDALALESEKSLFTNLIVVRKGCAKEPKLQQLKEALRDASTKKWMEEKYQGAILPVF